MSDEITNNDELTDGDSTDVDPETTDPTEPVADPEPSEDDDEGLIEFLDREGTVELVKDIKREVTAITGSLAKVFTATIDGKSWQGNEPPYYQTLSVSGLFDTDTPLVDVVPSSNYADATAQLNAWAEVFRCIALEGQLLVYAHTNGSTSIPIKIVCVRPVTGGTE